MAYKGYGRQMTECPFYVRDNKYSITCEGMAADTEAVTKFEDADKKMEYQRNNCFCWPNKCPVALHNMADEERWK